MFHWKEFLPFESVAPLVGGFAVWFGFCYIVLAPGMIAPRWVDKYYRPVCAYTVAHRAEQNMINRRNAAGAAAQVGVNQLMGMLGQAYGEQGREFARYYGKELSDKAANIAGQSVDYATMQEEAAKVPSRFVDFCDCNANEAEGENFDWALYTATARLYKPEIIRRMEKGGTFPACGNAPL